MKHPITLTAIDRKILSILQRDSTFSHADLAERVGASSASCWRRVKALETAGLLLKPVRLLDPEILGRSVNVFCNIRLKDHSEEARIDFETFVDRCPEIVECFSMSGDWDYMLRIVATDVADYNRFLMNTMLGHHTVAGASSHFALETTKYTTALPL